VRKYRDELLLVASCDDSIDLPSGFLTGPEIPEESMQVLLSSLSWVRQLASAWQSPNSTALMKSKGLLFLFVYVWVCTAISGNGSQLGILARHSIMRSFHPVRSSAAMGIPNTNITLVYPVMYHTPLVPSCTFCSK
jgi:hypothetical protein